MTINELIDEGQLEDYQVCKANRNLKNAFSIQGCEHFSLIWQTLENENEREFSASEIIEQITEFVSCLR